MFKYFLFSTILQINFPISAQSSVQGKNGIHLVSESCKNAFLFEMGYLKRDSAGIIRGYWYNQELERDSLIKLEIEDSIPLRPTEVDHGLEISITKDAMKALLKVFGFERKFNEYKWRLSWCANSIPSGLDPAQSVRAKEMMSIWFEVNELNEISVGEIYQYSYNEKKQTNSFYPHHADESVIRSAFTQYVVAKSAVWKERNVLAQQVIWIYCPSNYLKKKLKK